MLQRGDLVLQKAGSELVSRIINFFTQSDYSHVGLVVATGHLTDKKGSSVQQYFDVIESRLVKGVHLSRYKLGDPRFDIYRHRSIDKELANEVINLAHGYLGRKYDWKGLVYRSWLTITFRRRNPNKWNDKASVYCSELVAEVYDKVGLTFNKHVPISNIAPENIAGSKYTDLIEE